MLKGSFPILYAKDIEELVHFYCHALGCQKAYQWPEESKPEFILLRLGDSSVGITSREAVMENRERELDLDLTAERSFEICLLVEDIDGVVVRLNNLGVKQLTPVTQKPWGEKMTYFKDSEGNILHIASNG